MPLPAPKALFIQNDFTGGLNAQLDGTKIPSNAYPLLINGRTRKNTIAPTNRHVKLTGPVGSYQGLYIAGDFMLLFSSGMAYYADITADEIIFKPVGSWSAFDASVSRVYAELVPATSNLFNNSGSPQNTVKTFNSSLAVFSQALFCFDGKNPPQAVMPDGQAHPLGTYATWTKDNPLYVPIGVLPAFASNKLFVADPDRIRLLASISGRCSDFVTNLDTTGDKGGDASTVSQTVSYNQITAIRSVSTGEVLVGTLYGTFVVELDYANTIFGEPDQRPRFLFPAGPVNEISIVDILSDTAFISQSGIHAFNAVMQAKRESNNFPLGAKIRGLLTDPTTGKAIVQSDTCATLYDDYAFFAVETIYGDGVLVYDTISETWQSFDLSFGPVKQFATTKISGIERLFFITHDNEIYEAFASTEQNVTRALLGEWSPAEAPARVLSYMIDCVFGNVQSSGNVKFSIYANHKLVESTVLRADLSTSSDLNLPITIPFLNADSIITAGFHFKHRGTWKLAAMVEWDFNGELTNFSVDGKVETSDNTNLTLPEKVDSESFAFMADSGYADELNTGGAYDASGVAIVNVVKGAKYAFMANGDRELINGSSRITQGTFMAAANTVAVRGYPSSAKLFSLRTATNYLAVLDAINEDNNISTILHGGDFAYENGTQLDVEIAALPIRKEMLLTPGNHDIVTSSGKYFFNLLKTPRYYSKSFEYCDFFFFNGNASEPDGISATSLQTAAVRNWLAQSTKPYKILIVHQAPYTNDEDHYPGTAALRYLAGLDGLSAILSGHGHVMEKFVINGFPYFVCGTGGHSLRNFEPNTSSAFRESGTLGYLHITADPLTCLLTFRDTDNNILDSYALYA